MLAPLLRALACALPFSLALLAQGPKVTLPAFTGYAHPDPERMQKNDADGSVSECHGELVFYVQIAAPGPLVVQLDRTDGAPAQSLRATFAPQPGDALDTATVAAAAGVGSVALGTFAAKRAGYHRIALATGDGTPLRNLRALQLSGAAAAGLRASTVERRNAASVHLGYDVPKDARDDVEWFYLEITPRTDPLWTYYMATGWQRGYFGMQVNSPSERRVIFSVWDSGSEAKDRAKVADDDRVQLIAKGDDVHASDFGNEGTGGHSHLVVPWQLGATFRFLVHAAVDGTHTTYTGWFWFAEQQQWGLIASFRAPKDGQRLHGLYSFNENFGGANGDRARDCEFGNGWVRTSRGDWLPLRSARFTHDGHGKEQRLDRSGGVRGERFFLHNGGFDVTPSRSGERFELATAPGAHPLDAELPTPPKPVAR